MLLSQDAEEQVKQTGITQHLTALVALSICKTCNSKVYLLTFTRYSAPLPLKPSVLSGQQKLPFLPQCYAAPTCDIRKQILHWEMQLGLLPVLSACADCTAALSQKPHFSACSDKTSQKYTKGTKEFEILNTLLNSMFHLIFKYYLLKYYGLTTLLKQESTTAKHRLAQIVFQKVSISVTASHSISAT